MRKFVFVLAILAISTAANAQKLKRYSGPESYAEEFFDGLDFKKDERKIFQDSLLPQLTAVLDDDQLKDWVDLSNNLLRKRVLMPDFWEELFRFGISLAQQEELDNVNAVLGSLVKSVKRLPSNQIKSYVHRLYMAQIHRVLGDREGVIWKAPYSIWELYVTDDGHPMWHIYDGDVIGNFKGDSTLIVGVAGDLNPEEAVFHAEGGTAYWSRAGLPEDEVYAKLAKWTLQTEKTSFQADSVELITTRYIDEPILGQFRERLSTQTKNPQYPQFFSYRNDYRLHPIVDDVHYQGGLSVRGNDFLGSSLGQGKTFMRFVLDGDTIITLKSAQFVLKDKMISSSDVEAVVHIENDSIYHRSCVMRYSPGIGQLRVTRGEEGLGYSSFLNTYHDLDMSIDQMTWQSGSSVVNFQNLNSGSEKAGIFESSQYFRATRMEQIAGLQRVHPLIELRTAGAGLGNENMDLKEFIRALRMPYEEGLRFLYQMAILGFVDLDVKGEAVTLHPKMFEYLLNWEGKRDYDVIQFASRIAQGVNAQLSLLNYDLDMAGIGQFSLSDSQQVNIIPSGGKITVREGMNFTFSGRINAGLFSFWGKDYSFSYDRFAIDMEQIDSMRFKVKQFDTPPSERPALVNVQTALQNLRGSLSIDRPNNKSSRKIYPQYPIFRSENDSYVYYDKPEIYGGVYDRNVFYMQVNPFEIDSLDNTSTDGIVFDATFFSGGIFRTMDQDLTVQRDYSLGFNTQLSVEPAYGGKGTYEGELTLSNLGLHANGRIDYLQSYATSTDFTMFLDSTKGLAQVFHLDESASGLGYPRADAQSARTRWLPYSDLLEVRNTASPFTMYDPDIAMVAEGLLRYQPTGLTGTGELRYDLAKHNSINDGYTFYRRSFTSENQDFRVKARADDEFWAFQMLRSKADVNFDQRQGIFDKVDPEERIEFPVNRYAALMDHAEWAMDQGIVDVKRLTDDNAYMVSTHPKQDSLDFSAGFARMSFFTNLLEGFNVPFIEVADSRIYPDSGYVAIHADAAMDPLDQSAITTNTTTELHKFYNAFTRIYSKNRFTSKGMYDYVDEEGTVRPLFFESIKPNDLGETVGQAKVEETDSFYLSPFFAYRGAVELYASQASMYFQGSILIQHMCENLQTTWFDIQSFIDPGNIIITLPENDPNQLRDNTFSGIYISQDSLGGHSNFLSKYADRRDIELLTSTGVLLYNRENKGYVITSLERLEDETVPDPYLIFHDQACDLEGSGRLKILENTGLVENQLAGSVRHDLKTDSIFVDAVWTMDAPLDKKAWEDLSIIFYDNTSTIDESNFAYSQGMNSILGTEGAQSFFSQFDMHMTEGKFPKELRKSLVLSGVQLQYNTKYKTFMGQCKATIQNIYNQPVFSEVDALIEIKERGRGGQFTVYLDNGNDYIFYNFKGSMMSILTSEDLFNTAIIEKNPDDRSVKAKGDEPGFTYNRSSKGKIMLLERRFGIEPERR